MIPDLAKSKAKEPIHPPLPLGRIHLFALISRGSMPQSELMLEPTLTPHDQDIPRIGVIADGQESIRVWLF